MTLSPEHCLQEQDAPLVGEVGIWVGERMRHSRQSQNCSWQNKLKWTTNEIKT